MSNKLRIAHLTWLRAPIEKSVDTTKINLDIYHKKTSALASPPADAEPIWYENQRTHRDAAFANVKREVEMIHSALAVAVCEGGSSLALEVKILVNSVAQQSLAPEKIEQALVSVMGSLLTIPKYIGMIIDGAPDSAGILAKQINELREIRGVPLLEEDNLLPPDTEFVYVEPPLRDRDCTDDHRRDVFGRSPKRFQTAFSLYMTNQSKTALADLRDTLRELQQVTRDLEVGCFWWLGEALTDALACGAIRSAGNTLSQVRMLSVAIQKAEMEGEEGAKATLGIARFKTLLSVLSMSTKLPPEIEEVLGVFNVRKSVDAASLAELQARIETAQVDSIKDVILELKPLLETSMVSLGRAITTKNQQPFDAQMATFRTSIRQVASVFYMVNENELAAVAAKSLTRVEKVTSVDGFTDPLVEALKTDFMFMDEHIRNLGSKESVRSLKIPGVQADVVAEMVDQAIKELAKARRSITDHLDSGSGRDDLISGLEGLVRSAAALSFTGLTRVGQVLNGSCQGFVGEMTESGIKPSQAIDLSARALVAVESYLVAISTNVEPSPSLMTKAEEALGALGIHIDQFEAASTSELLEKFEAAKTLDADLDSDENHFLSEIFDLRKVFEALLQNPDCRDRSSMDVMYKAAERLGMAAKLNGFDSFHRLARALAAFSQSVQNRSRDEGYDREAADSLIKKGLQMIFRCMDEYSARSKVSIFTRDLEQALLSAADPATVFPLSTEEVPAEQILPEPMPSALVGELVLERLGDEQLEYPEGVDAGLIAEYREEFVTYYDVLIAFCRLDAPLLTKNVCRAAHTLHGISGSADCQVLHEVFGVLEARLESLQIAERRLRPCDLLQLENLLGETKEFMEKFPWTVQTPLAGIWMETAASIGDDIAEAEFVDMPPPAKPSTQAQDMASVAVHSEDETQVAETEKFSHAKSSGSQGSLVREYNDDSSFYLEEADDVLPDLQANVDAWLSDMTNRELVATIKRNMHTLKGAAMMAGADSIAAITHNMESLFESISIKLITPSGDCAQLVSYVLDSITTMTTLMRQGDAYEPPQALIECLELCVDMNEIDLSSLHVQKSGPTSIAPQPSVTTIELPIDPVPSVPESDHGDPGQNLSVALEDEGPKQSRKKRGGRGRGNRNRVDLPQNVVAQSGENEGASVGPLSESVSHKEEEVHKPVDESAASAPEDDLSLVVAEAIELATDAQEPAVIAAPQDEAESAEADVHANQPAESIREKISHAESFIQPGAQIPQSISEKISHAEILLDAPTREDYAEQAEKDFDRLYSMETIDDAGDEKPIASTAVMDMLEREQSDAAAYANKKGNAGTSEKIRVDLKHLESASQQASELIAVRYRLNSLNEEAHLRLTGARELLDSNTLQHGQLTTALRSFFNNQPQARKAEDVEGADLERFNDLSAMHVAMGAQVDEVREQVHEIFAFMRQMRSALWELEPLLTSLQRDLLHSRLVPFQNVRQKLLSAVTTAAAATKKDVAPEFTGADVIMDKMMQDAIAEPLTHILRNAIDHGIESSAERTKLGKPAKGRVEVNAYRRAKHIIIEIKDDGRGIDTEAVLRKAIERGIVSEKDQLSRSEIIELITRSGFSTAEVITAVSGRGVGMDIVASAVDNLGGRLYIESVKGQGTSFQIELPFTIGSNKAMMVNTGSQWFAIQSYSMSQVILVSRESLDSQRQSSGNATVIYEGRNFEVVHLADLVAMPDSRGRLEKNGEVTLILCEQGDTRIAIEVAKVDSMPEIHIRKLEGILSNVRGIVGETEMQDGSPVFVLDVMELARLNLKRSGNGYQVRQNRVRSMKRDNKPTVFVVDDSPSYRKQLERIFSGFGYEVVTAVDGQNALHKLPLDRKPDLMMVDVEMPNMNGFEFTEAIRKMPEYDDTPIIMITTRTGLEEKALRAGVNKYLQKPCDAATLQQAVNQLTGQTAHTETIV